MLLDFYSRTLKKLVDGFLFDETKKVKMMNFSPFKANINSLKVAIFCLSVCYASLLHDPIYISLDKRYIFSVQK